MARFHFAALLIATFWAFAMRSVAAQSGDTPLPLALETPECVVSQSGRADCLTRDRAGRFVWQFHDGRKWSRPQLLAGEFSGPASCVVRGPLGLNCFAIRRDGSLWHLAMNGGRWRQWRPLGGRLQTGRPSCVAPARNQISCYARSQQGTLAIKTWFGDSLWQEWRDAGGDLGSDPSCVRLSYERVACFWRRNDGRLSGLLPAETGPGGAILTLPQSLGTPVCATLEQDRATCVGRAAADQPIEWRGQAVLGGVGADGFKPMPSTFRANPVCRTRANRTLCAYLSGNGVMAMAEAIPQGWSANLATGLSGVAVPGPCYVFDSARTACFAVSVDGEMRVAFREINGTGQDVSVAAAAPEILEKPAVPAAAGPSTPTQATAIAPVATVSVREPLGGWRVFEPRTGLHCQITLYDAPAQPYRSLTRDKDCAAMESLRDIDRWSHGDGAIVLRDRRGRVLFRFFEAGPTALRARWRRSDFIMMARDLRAFAAAPSSPAPTPPANTTPPVSPGLAGVWRIKGPGRQSCSVRLSVDPATAATRAEPQGCQGALAQADGWSFRRGALVLERKGAPLARFVEGRGVSWTGRFEGGRRNLRMVKQ